MISYLENCYFSIHIYIYLLGIIIPADFHIFQRGGSTTNRCITHDDPISYEVEDVLRMRPDLAELPEWKIWESYISWCLGIS